MNGRARIPVIGLSGSLVVSIQVDLSDSLIAALQEDVASAVALRSPHGLAIDVSGVGVLDSYTTRSISDLGLVARLMGVPTVICGIQPAVAMTLAEMGIDLQGLACALTLDDALDLLRAGATGEVPSWSLDDQPS